MLGREAYHRPWLLTSCTRRLVAGAAAPEPDRRPFWQRMADYAARELARGERLPSITRHMLGLYAGEPGAREYRRLLSEGARGPGPGPTCCAGWRQSSGSTSVAYNPGHRCRRHYDSSARLHV